MYLYYRSTHTHTHTYMMYISDHERRLLCAGLGQQCLKMLKNKTNGIIGRTCIMYKNILLARTYIYLFLCLI